MKREKRLQKGIESLEEQRKLHEEKKKLAEEIGNQELVRYYSKEISSFEREIKDKEKKRDRKANR